ncbi:MAG TPA: hypothetical protein EYP85_07165 [Armatimonadetes bacterium]|nr:hypothetical protein [Armatimonadota bacterium]
MKEGTTLYLNFRKVICVLIATLAEDGLQGWGTGEVLGFFFGSIVGGLITGLCITFVAPMIVAVIKGEE